jgi:hypothetical protein
MLCLKGFYVRCYVYRLAPLMEPKATGTYNVYNNVLAVQLNNQGIFLNLQGCGSGLIQCGSRSGSNILAQGSGSGSSSKLKQNFRRQFLSQNLLKSKFESKQIKNTGVIHQFFSQTVVSAILYLYSGIFF